MPNNVVWVPQKILASKNRNKSSSAFGSVTALPPNLSLSLRRHPPIVIGAFHGARYPNHEDLNAPPKGIMCADLPDPSPASPSHYTYNEDPFITDIAGIDEVGRAPATHKPVAIISHPSTTCKHIPIAPYPTRPN
ncbi:hypothetical protein BC938DRAFT_476137 [Jimgerdemannia flammicorona]|uniref:Uncharacterized protein n=1 Tax=Jimgerdemannia flammicorona TaxID=994334 RepID=A0A433PJZ7_9FUNG|nr:hypothetical protein BC938DRAFT_476137 [Jimgerdemannia flammicorona]